MDLCTLWIVDCGSWIVDRTLCVVDVLSTLYDQARLRNGCGECHLGSNATYTFNIVWQTTPCMYGLAMCIYSLAKPLSSVTHVKLRRREAGLSIFSRCCTQQIESKGGGFGQY